MNVCMLTFFSKYLVIAVITTEVEQAVMSTLLYAYVYLYASWFTFTFKVVVMPIIKCLSLWRLIR